MLSIKLQIFATMKLPYSGHLSIKDSLLRNGQNDGQTLIKKPLRSGHFIGYTSL